MNNPKPLKRFGQNYLQDRNTILKIAATFDPKPTDIIVEIGPGRGALTSLLHNKVEKYYAIEIDRRVIDELKENYPTVEFINADFLDIPLSNFFQAGSKIRVIGNIPYNITSPIIFKLIESRHLVKDALLMMQYEVALRINSKPRTKDYGILGVITNYFSQTELCFKISPNVFYPKPSVYSAIVHFAFNKISAQNLDEALFIQTVKAAFGNRRKTLKNSLSNSVFVDVKIDALEFNLQRRAEELTIDDFITLTKIIQRNKNTSSI